MTTLSTKTFTDLVRGQVAAIQARATGLIDFTVGAIERAIVEAVVLVVLWLQGLILQLLTTTRASTSVGADLDTWVADFGLSRHAAAKSAGGLTFGRFTTTSAGLVPIGTTAETADGAQQFTVTTDTTNPAYSATLGGYTMAIGVGSVTVPAEALAAGSGGNAAAGSITLITGAAPGVDTVTNGSPFAGGADAETDAQLRARFIAFLASLPRGTKASIEAAIRLIQAGVSETLSENVTYAGSDQDGHFSVVVDDGTGTPSGGFITGVANLVEDYRAFTVSFEVHGPIVTTANLALTISVAGGYDSVAVKNAVIANLETYINGLGLGVALHFTRVAQIAYDTSAGVTNVTAVTVNSGTSDITADAKHVVKTGTVVVTIA